MADKNNTEMYAACVLQNAVEWPSLLGCEVLNGIGCDQELA
jgi:hypothetical protein